MSSLDDAWDAFLENVDDPELDEECEIKGPSNDGRCPKCSAIYISTKTQIAYLTSSVDLANVFWKIPLISYSEPGNGIIKKQMKFISLSQTELDAMRSNIGEYDCVDELVLSHVDNPTGRIKFKDVRKISLGLCKKDILSYRCKQKSAFYNCFVLIFRILHEGNYTEVHVKVFNTGKLEIPGIKCNILLRKVLDLLVAECGKYIPNLSWSPKVETVLINSNFNCGFYINRAKLNSIIRLKYQIACVYDPCSYPGIQCKFYYDTQAKQQTGALDSSLSGPHIKKISFMIFRTGSVLIVGKCSDDELLEIYEFLKQMLTTEYPLISEDPGDTILATEQRLKKTRKERRKTITIQPIE